MNQKKPARQPINVRKSIVTIVAATAAVLMILRVVKETRRSAEPIPLMTPLPAASSYPQKSTGPEEDMTKSIKNQNNEGHLGE